MSSVENTGIQKKKAVRNKGTAKMQWATYLQRVKQQAVPELGIASDAMFVYNGLVDHFVTKLIDTSYKVALDHASGTLKSKHARSAAALILHGKLLKYTNAAGEKAWAQYQEVA